MKISKIKKKLTGAVAVRVGIGVIVTLMTCASFMGGRYYGANEQLKQTGYMCSAVFSVILRAMTQRPTNNYGRMEN